MRNIAVEVLILRQPSWTWIEVLVFVIGLTMAVLAPTAGWFSP